MGKLCSGLICGKATELPRKGNVRALPCIELQICGFTWNLKDANVSKVHDWFQVQIFVRYNSF